MDETSPNGHAVSVVPDSRISETIDPVASIAEEVATYRARLPELLEHEGRFVLIKGSEVVGFFDDDSEAIREGYRRFGIVPLLVKRISRVERVIYIPNVVI